MATRRPLVLVGGELKELPAGDTMLSALLGATTVGDGLLKLPNPGALSFLRINADNTISALAAADFRSAIGAGTSSFDGAFSSLSGRPTTLSGYGITDAQGLDADLTALAGLSANGLIARTGSGTAAARTITGTANQVIVTNGDGVAGNPTLSLPQNIATTSTPQFAGLQIVGAGAAAKVAGSGVTIPSMFDSAFGFQTAAPATVANYYQADTFGSYSGFVFHRSNGTSASPTAVASGDLIGFFAGGGYDGTARVSNQAAIFWYASENWTGSARGERIDFYSTPTGSTSSILAIRISGAALRFAGYGAGTLVTDSSGNVTASSDRRLKNVSGKFTRGLDAILQIQPKVFTWKPESGMNPDDINVGFIAQDVQPAIPEAVGSMKTVDTEEDDGTGKKVKKTKREASEFLTLSDRPIIAALVNAVKELKAENDDLRARVSALEKGKAPK